MARLVTVKSGNCATCGYCFDLGARTLSSHQSALAFLRQVLVTALRVSTTKTEVARLDSLATDALGREAQD
jgi:hypothetical protein